MSGEHIPTQPMLTDGGTVKLENPPSIHIGQVFWGELPKKLIEIVEIFDDGYFRVQLYSRDPNTSQWKKDYSTEMMAPQRLRFWTKGEPPVSDSIDTYVASKSVEVPASNSVSNGFMASVEKGGEQNTNTYEHIQQMSEEDQADILGKISIRGDKFNDKSLSVSDLSSHNLLPQWKLNIEGSNILTSAPYKLEAGRVAVVMYVQRRGGFVARSYYLSNSQGLWRYMPSYHSDEKGNLVWYGKGYDEQSVTAPSLVQQALAEVSQNSKYVEISQSDANFVFAGTARKFNSEEQTFLSEIESRPKNFEGIQSQSDGVKISPESIQLNTEQSPDFSHRIGSWEQESSLYGTLHMESFVSHDKKFIFTFCTDNDGRSWLGNIEDNSDILTTGLKKTWIHAHDLTTPLYEYKTGTIDQTGGYGNDEIRNGPYVDMYVNYVRKIPVIAEYSTHRHEKLFPAEKIAQITTYFDEHLDSITNGEEINKFLYEHRNNDWIAFLNSTIMSVDQDYFTTNNKTAFAELNMEKIEPFIDELFISSKEKELVRRFYKKNIEVLNSKQRESIQSVKTLEELDALFDASEIGGLYDREGVFWSGNELKRKHDIFYEEYYRKRTEETLLTQDEILQYMPDIPLLTGKLLQIYNENVPFEIFEQQVYRGYEPARQGKVAVLYKIVQLYEINGNKMVSVQRFVESSIQSGKFLEGKQIDYDLSVFLRRASQMQDVTDKGMLKMSSSEHVSGHNEQRSVLTEGQEEKKHFKVGQVYELLWSGHSGKSVVRYKITKIEDDGSIHADIMSERVHGSGQFIVLRNHVYSNENFRHLTKDISPISGDMDSEMNPQQPTGEDRDEERTYDVILSMLQEGIDWVSTEDELIKLIAQPLHSADGLRQEVLSMVTGMQELLPHDSKERAVDEYVQNHCAEDTRQICLLLAHKLRELYIKEQRDAEKSYLTADAISQSGLTRENLLSIIENSRGIQQGSVLYESDPLRTQIEDATLENVDQITELCGLQEVVRKILEQECQDPNNWKRDIAKLTTFTGLEMYLSPISSMSFNNEGPLSGGYVMDRIKNAREDFLKFSKDKDAFTIDNPILEYIPGDYGIKQKVYELLMQEWRASQVSATEGQAETEATEALEVDFNTFLRTIEGGSSLNDSQKRRVERQLYQLIAGDIYTRARVDVWKTHNQQSSPVAHDNAVGVVGSIKRGLARMWQRITEEYDIAKKEQHLAQQEIGNNATYKKYLSDLVKQAQIDDKVFAVLNNISESEEGHAHAARFEQIYRRLLSGKASAETLGQFADAKRALRNITTEDGMKTELDTLFAKCDEEALWNKLFLDNPGIEYDLVDIANDAYGRAFWKATLDRLKYTGTGSLIRAGAIAGVTMATGAFLAPVIAGTVAASLGAAAVGAYAGRRMMRKNMEKSDVMNRAGAVPHRDIQFAPIDTSLSEEEQAKIREQNRLYEETYGFAERVKQGEQNMLSAEHALRQSRELLELFQKETDESVKDRIRERIYNRYNFVYRKLFEGKISFSDQDAYRQKQELITCLSNMGMIASEVARDDTHKKKKSVEKRLDAKLNKLHQAIKQARSKKVKQAMAWGASIGALTAGATRAAGEYMHEAVSERFVMPEHRLEMPEPTSLESVPPLPDVEPYMSPLPEVSSLPTPVGISSLTPAEVIIHGLPEGEQVVTVQTGDSVWKILHAKLAEDESFRSLSPLEQNRAIGKFLIAHVYSASPDELKAAGIMSGNPDLIHPGEEIDVSKLLEIKGGTAGASFEPAEVPVPATDTYQATPDVKPALFKAPTDATPFSHVSIPATEEESVVIPDIRLGEHIEPTLPVGTELAGESAVSFEQLTPETRAFVRTAIDELQAVSDRVDGMMDTDKSSRRLLKTLEKLFFQKDRINVASVTDELEGDIHDVLVSLKDNKYSWYEIGRLRTILSDLHSDIKGIQTTLSANTVDEYEDVLRVLSRRESKFFAFIQDRYQVESDTYQQTLDNPRFAPIVDRLDDAIDAIQGSRAGNTYEDVRVLVQQITGEDLSTLRHLDRATYYSQLSAKLHNMGIHVSARQVKQLPLDFLMRAFAQYASTHR